MEARFESKGSVLEAEVIQVIRTKSVAGEGTKDNPSRAEVRYWGFDGQLLALSLSDVDFFVSFSSLDLRK